MTSCAFGTETFMRDWKDKFRYQNLASTVFTIQSVTVCSRPNIIIIQKQSLSPVTDVTHDHRTGNRWNWDKIS